MSSAGITALTLIRATTTIYQPFKKSNMEKHRQLIEAILQLDTPVIYKVKRKDNKLCIYPITQLSIESMNDFLKDPRVTKIKITWEHGTLVVKNK